MGLYYSKGNCIFSIYVGVYSSKGISVLSIHINRKKKFVDKHIIVEVWAVFLLQNKILKALLSLGYSLYA
jgi:hypothetical protein